MEQTLIEHALADVFANCDMASVNDGSTNTGRSTDMLDISTAATTANLDVRIVGLYEDEGNTVILLLDIST